VSITAVATKRAEYAPQITAKSRCRGTMSTILLYATRTTETTTSENIFACGWYSSPTTLANTESLSERIIQ